MNITFLIGNGFDLNCGLKSKYSDVYDQYCSTQSDQECIQRFKKEIKSDYETWGDFEVAMAEHMAEFETESDFIACLRDFKTFLNRYLLDQITKINELIGEEEKQKTFQAIQHSVGNFYKDVTHNLTNEIQSRISREQVYKYAIVFNYTQLFERLSTQRNGDRYSKIFSEVINVHGVLNDDIVLGMDNESQLVPCKSEKEITKRIKRAFIKPIFNEEYDSERIRRAKAIIDDSDIICVYGMSLGKSDLTWRELLFDWLLRKEDGHLFIFDYANVSVKAKTVDERLDIEDMKRNSFFDRMELDKERSEKIEARLHMPLGKNLFNINEIINSSKKNSQPGVTTLS